MLPQVDVLEVVDRTVEALANRLGRSPTVEEISEAAGIGYDDVLTALDLSRPLSVDHIQRALYLRCAEGLDQGEIARRMGVRRLEVSQLLRAANLSQRPPQPRPRRVASWSRSHSHSVPASLGARRTSSPG
jgi:DNA-directed RNA polymerase specialized sigma subunit